MLRGVNKKIIEITQTDNQYFEKAILFVRQGHLERDDTELEHHARDYVSGVSAQMPAAAAPTAGAATGTKERLDLKSVLVKGGIGVAVAAAALVLFL